VIQCVEGQVRPGRDVRLAAPCDIGWPRFMPFRVTRSSHPYRVTARGNCRRDLTHQYLRCVVRDDIDDGSDSFNHRERAVRRIRKGAP
jgi:hypothetical protein